LKSRVFIQTADGETNMHDHVITFLRVRHKIKIDLLRDAIEINPSSFPRIHIIFNRNHAPWPCEAHPSFPLDKAQ